MKKSLNSASCGVELCFLLMAFLHLLFECRDSTRHSTSVRQFSSLRDAFKGTYAVLQELHFYGKPHAKNQDADAYRALPKQAMG
ncbi:hypothetical protein ACLK10_18955 [Escherichia coli]